MVCTATVVAHGAGDRLQVRFRRQLNCEACERGVGCGAALRKGPSREWIHWSAPLPPVGSDIAVRLPQSPLAAATRAYGLPLAGTLLGSTVGVLAGGTDASAALGAVVGLGAALLMLWRWRPA
ncbi:MAG: SoxR reducing system RseC family protein [Pseudomonadota bacterium]